MRVRWERIPAADVPALDCVDAPGTAGCHELDRRVKFLKNSAVVVRRRGRETWLDAIFGIRRLERAVFDLSPDDIQQAIVDTLHEFAEREIRPAARDAEKEGQPPEAVLKQLVDMGFTSGISEEFGGAGELSAVTTTLVAEELAWGDPGIAAAVVFSAQPGLILRYAASDEQKRQWLPQLASGEFVKGSLMLYEPSASNPNRPKETTARRYGKDWIIEGRKSGVPWPKGADFRVVVAGIEGTDQAGAFVLPKEARVDVVRSDADTGKIGLKAFPTGEVELRRVVVKNEMLVGGLQSSALLELALCHARMTVGAIAVGLSRAAMEYASDYAKQRVAFGKPIGAFQGVSFMIADMATDIDGARLAVWAAADSVDKGVAATRSVALANSKALEVAYRCGTDSVQVLGGHGFITDHPVEKWYRDAAALAAFEGDPGPLAELAEVYE